MKKYDKMVLKAIANEFDVIQGKVTFLETFSRGGFITRLTFRIEYNKFENIVYECNTSFLSDTVILEDVVRVGTWDEYIS